MTCEDQALPVPSTTITLPFISTSVTLALWSRLLMSAVNVNCADVCGHDAHSAGGLSRHNRQPAPQRCERCNACSLAIAHTAQITWPWSDALVDACHNVAALDWHRDDGRHLWEPLVDVANGYIACIQHVLARDGKACRRWNACKRMPVVCDCLDGSQSHQR